MDRREFPEFEGGNFPAFLFAILLLAAVVIVLLSRSA